MMWRKLTFNKIRINGITNGITILIILFNTSKLDIFFKRSHDTRTALNSSRNEDSYVHCIVPVPWPLYSVERGNILLTSGRYYEMSNIAHRHNSLATILITDVCFSEIPSRILIIASMP